MTLHGIVIRSFPRRHHHRQGQHFIPLPRTLHPTIVIRSAATTTIVSPPSNIFSNPRLYCCQTVKDQPQFIYQWRAASIEYMFRHVSKANEDCRYECDRGAGRHP
jgi:hypothetical protein